MNIHFIQHESFEAPGAYYNWAKNRNHNITFSKVFEGDNLPQNAENIDILIVMGGPQDPNTTTEECSHFNAQAEINLIKKCIDAGKAVVGICLGSQLIGESLGAKFDHSPEKEIGSFPIQLTEAGLNDDKIKHFGEKIIVGHWHNDMPGLTADSQILATSEGCPRQIVRYSDLVYGFQCHMEITSEVAKLLVESEKDLEKLSQEYRFVKSPQEILDFDYSEMNQKLYGFLDKLEQAYQQSLK